MNEGQQQKPAGQWQYKSGDGTVGPITTGAASSSAAPHDEPMVQWTASEFIAHHKGARWYVLLSLGTVLLAELAFLLTHDHTTAGAIVVCGLVFGISGARKPRVLAYRLDDSGVTVGAKFYPYANYKAFALIDEGRFASISFLPLKRFMPALSIYFAPEDEDRIVTMLAEQLPLQPGGLSFIDGLMHRLRF